MSSFADLTPEKRHRYATQASLVAATSAELARALLEEDDHSAMQYCAFMASVGDNLLAGLCKAFSAALNAECPDTIEELLASTTIETTIEKLVTEKPQRNTETNETGNQDGNATTSDEP